MDEWLTRLSAKRVSSVGLGDENVAASRNGGNSLLGEIFIPWHFHFFRSFVL